MAFSSSLFCSSKFREHTHTLTKRLTVLACSDNNKDVRTPSIFGSFYPNVRIFFLCQNNSFFFFFFFGAVFCAPVGVTPESPAYTACRKNCPWSGGHYPKINPDGANNTPTRSGFSCHF